MVAEISVAVLEGKPPVVRVMALNEKGRRLGMQMGMTKIEAAVFAGSSAEDASVQKENSFASGKAKQGDSSAPTTSRLAILRQRSLEQEISAHSALLDVAHAFTPRVEDTASDTLLLDLTGMERLYGAPAKVADAFSGARPCGRS